MAPSEPLASFITDTFCSAVTASQQNRLSKGKEQTSQGGNLFVGFFFFIIIITFLTDEEREKNKIKGLTEEGCFCFFFFPRG